MAKSAASSFPSVGTRHVWLALLGVVAVAERRSCKAVNALAGDAARTGTRLRQLATDTGYVLRGAAMTVQERVEPVVQRVAADVDARMNALRRDVGIALKQPRKSGTGRRRRTA